MVGTQDLFFASRIVGGSARVLDEAAPAGSAAVTLLAFRGVPVSNGVTAIAMAAIWGLGRFVFHHVPQCIPTTPVEPLPGQNLPMVRQGWGISPRSSTPESSALSARASKVLERGLAREDLIPVEERALWAWRSGTSRAFVSTRRAARFCWNSEIRTGRARVWASRAVRLFSSSVARPAS